MNKTLALEKYEKKTNALKILSFVVMTVAVASVILFGMFGLTLDKDKTFSPFYYGMFSGMVVFFAASLPLFFSVSKRVRILARYNAFSKVLMRNPHNSVAEISEVLNVDPKTVTGDFASLNELGFFEGLTVDVENSKVDLFTGEDKITYVCPVCGGSNEVDPHGDVVCAFCGAVKEKENK